MPTYSYECVVCKHAEDRVRAVANRDEPYSCPKCEAFGAMKRNVLESMKPHTDTGFQRAHLSRALGVNPEQIPEMQKMFPHHKFAPDGRMVIESAKEFDRIKKDLGFEHM